VSDKAIQMSILVVLLVALTAAVLDLSGMPTGGNQVTIVALTGLIGGGLTGLLALVARNGAGGTPPATPAPPK
jgi:hypothetical protein